VSIVMGLDQHRGQITGEWIDSETGEVQRARVAPADRAAVRKFLARFRGRKLEVALEATTGWRFVVEELHRVGARVHLAEPAETAGLRGPKKRAKGDRADARHLRELLMLKRLPESWIPAHTTRCASSARRHSSPHELPGARQALHHTDAPAGSRQSPAATPAWTALKDRAAATLAPAGSPHQTSCRRPGANPGRGPK
jgi:transposase